MSNHDATSTPPSQGFCDKAFTPVREAFAHNLEQEDEIGAAVCIYVAGRPVVDLWGGFANVEEQVPWRHDTLVNAYSVGKGVMSALVLALAERGILDLDLRVADVWPEFGQADKQDVRLPTLMSHAAGLPSVRKRLPEGAMLDWPLMCDSLAEQEPWWAPGTRHGYHTATFGYLVGEVVRRATGLMPGAALRKFLAGPLEADFTWGLEHAELERVAHLYSPAADNVVEEEDWALVFPPTGDPEHDLMRWHGYFNPSGLTGGGITNTPEWRQAAVPSANGHGTARGVARIYDALLGGWRDAAPLVSRSLGEFSRTPLADGDDLLLQRPSRFGLGFQLTQPSRPLGRGDGTFGHYGYGGSIGFADPANEIAFGYLRNKPGDRWRTPHTLALVDALYDTLGVEP